jgi:hypothetical protein
VLCRGETFRWGCSPLGVQRQVAAVQSHITMLTAPLEASGHRVDGFLAMGGSHCPNVSLTDASLALTQLARNGRLHVSPPLGAARSQAHNVRRALDWLLALASDAFDMLIVIRFDMLLLRNVSSWKCPLGETLPTKLFLGGVCKSPLFDRYGCASDLMFVVPRVHLAVFNTSIGSHVVGGSSTCNTPRTRLKECFSGVCGQSLYAGSGHGCYNVLRQTLPESEVKFCWKLAADMSATNKYYSIPSCDETTARLRRCHDR